MKTLYLDIFSGISGDMFLAAMIDLGVDLGRLELELGKLGVTGYHLHADRRQKGSISGVKFDVHLEGDHDHDREHEEGSRPHSHSHSHSHDDHDHHHHPDEIAPEPELAHIHGHRHGHEHEDEHEHEHGHVHHPHDKGHEHGGADSRDFGQIKGLIRESGLPDWVKDRAISVFQRVAVAEGKIHGHPPEKVHFHEVGAIDSIVDIVGACVALDLLGRPRVVAAPVVEGTGWVTCAHGRFPVPTTATLEILGARGIPISQCEEPHELVTPTGAALLAEFAEEFGPMRNLRADKIGYGLGTRENRTRPNVLRAILGEVPDLPEMAGGPEGMAARDWEIDTVAVLETNLDDCSGEILGYFVERALGAGALDVFHTPIQMKKNRPGVLLTVLCASADADRFSEMLLRETSAFGVRRTTMERRKLRRAFTTVRTPYGEVKVKLGTLDGTTLRATPEFESCRMAAEQAKVPLNVVYESVEQMAGTLWSAAGSPTPRRFGG